MQAFINGMPKAELHVPPPVEVPKIALFSCVALLSRRGYNLSIQGCMGALKWCGLAEISKFVSSKCRRIWRRQFELWWLHAGYQLNQPRPPQHPLAGGIVSPHQISQIDAF